MVNYENEFNIFGDRRERADAGTASETQWIEQYPMQGLDLKC